MSYSVLSGGTSFDVKENTSNVTIELGLSYDVAKTLCKTLNQGAGFDGWTPPFFAVKFEQPKGN